MHGYGVFKWPDGRKYCGTYFEDLRDGKGVYEWANGKRLEGSWEKGTQHGPGILYSGPNGQY